MTLAFSRPGKPNDHADIESFNGRLREEGVNVHRFEDVTEARAKMQGWKQEYNEERPHDTLGAVRQLSTATKMPKPLGPVHANATPRR